LGRCSVPLAWMSYARTQTFAPTWSSEASERFRRLAKVLEASSRRGLAALPYRNRVAIAVVEVLHRESRSRLARKVDRVADTLIRHSAGAFWATLVPMLRNLQRRVLKLFFRFVDAAQQRSLKPLFESSHADASISPIEVKASQRPKSLPVRELETALRNQSVLMGREL